MHRLFLFLLLFSLPFQLGLHFWPSSSFLLGLPIDYLSPVLYLTDIFLILYLLTSFSLLRRSFSSSLLRRYLPLLLFVVILNTVLSSSPLTSFWAWLRLLLYFFLFLSLIQEKKILSSLRLPLTLSTLIVILLQLLQFSHQASLQGIFYFLGERNLSLTTPFTAKINFFSHQIFRPYSTFSHPNSLAGYLLLLLALSQAYFPSLISLVILSLSVILTFSKTAILTLPLLLLPSSLLTSIFPLFIFLGLYPFSVSFLSSSFFSSAFFLSLPQTISQRLLLSRPILPLFSRHLLTGTGLHSYLPSLSSHLSPSFLTPTNLQPLHSTLLLILLELGLLPFIPFAFLFKKNKKKSFKFSPLSRRLFISFLLIITLTGAFDHYWWTLTQNQLILTLILAVVFNHGLNKKTYH